MNGSTLALAHSAASLLLLLASLFTIYEIALYVLKTPSMKLGKILHGWKAAVTRFFSSAATTNRGVAKVLCLAFVFLIAMAGAVGYAIRAQEHHAGVVDTYYDVYVVSNPDGAYRYWLDAHDQDGKPIQRLYLHFCDDFEPEFAPGQTLTILKVEHKFGCVSVANTHPGYRIKRGPDGKPQITN